jgi:hypothetical protein
MQRPILTTHFSPQTEFWRERTEMLDRRRLGRTALLKRLVADAPADGGLEGAVAFRHGYVDLIAAGIVGRRRTAPGVVLSECGWEPGSRTLGRGLPQALRRSRDSLPFAATAHRAVAAIDSPQTIYCVLSRREVELFSTTWGIDESRVRCTPFFVTTSETGAQGDGSVFAGGDSLRDYEPLVKAATSIAAPVHIATGHLDGRELPPNVHAGRVPPARFYELMHRASIVVVPLAAGRIRSAGLLTYLNAMAMGKLVVVTDSLGVRDYVSPGKTGLIVPEGNAQALAEALRWALDPDNSASVTSISERARLVRRQFTLERYLRTLLEIAEESMQLARH